MPLRSNCPRSHRQDQPCAAVGLPRAETLDHYLQSGTVGHLVRGQILTRLLTGGSPAALAVRVLKSRV